MALAPAAAHAEEVAEATINPQDAIVQAGLFEMKRTAGFSGEPEAFALTFVSEIGDKTFFIAAILAAGSSASDGLSQKARGKGHTDVQSSSNSG